MQSMSFTDLDRHITGNYGEDQFNRRPFGTNVQVTIYEDGYVRAKAYDDYGWEIDQFETRVFDGESDEDAASRAQDELFALCGWDGE